MLFLVGKSMSAETQLKIFPQLKIVCGKSQSGGEKIMVKENSKALSLSLSLQFPYLIFMNTSNTHFSQLGTLPF